MQIFVLILMVIVALNFLAPLLFTIILPSLGETDFTKIDLMQPKYSYTFAFCSMLALFLLGVLAFGRITNTSVKKAVKLSGIKVKTTTIVLGVLILAWFVSDALYLLNHEILLQFPDYGYIEQEAEYNLGYLKMFNAEQPGLLPFAILIYAALPAFVEEIVFRGLLMKKLQLVSGDFHFGVIVSALLFAAFHMQAWNLLPIFGMGVILGYIYHYTKDIRYTMLCHFLYNGIQLTFMFFIPELVM